VTDSLGSSGATSCTACPNQRFSTNYAMACTRCPVNSAMGINITNASSAATCLCNSGYVRAADGYTCRRCGARDEFTPGCSAFRPPQISIRNLTHASKIIPSKPIVLQARVTTSNGEAASLQWSIWRLTALVDVKLDLSGLVLSPAASFENLVVAAHSLSPGQSYRARLTASTASGSSTAELFFSVNAPPVNGTLSVLPRAGMSLNQFNISAPAWQDTDLPLQYTFFVLSDMGTSQRLNTAQFNNTLRARLPPGGKNNNVNVSVVVADVYAAVSEYINQSVSVLSFKPTNQSWLATTDTLLGNTSASKVDLQLVSVLAANMNKMSQTSPNLTNSMETDIAQTRELLVSSLSNTLEMTTSDGVALDEAAVDLFASCLNTITVSSPDSHRASEQLTSASIDTAFAVLDLLTGPGSSATLSQATAATLADTTSTLIHATATIESGNRTTATARIASAFTVMSQVGKAVASELVIGSPPIKIKANAFNMQVEKIGQTSTQQPDNESSSHQYVAIDEGNIEVPIAEIQPNAAGSSKSAAVTSQVLHWSVSPFGFANETQLGSSVVSLRLFNADNGHPLVVQNLSQPIKVALRGKPSNGTDCAQVACVNAYDRAQQRHGACSELLAGGYTCEQHLCDGCPFESFCRRECSSNSCPTPDANITCALQPQRLCSYFDVARGLWTADGTATAHNSSTGTTICAFSHLTSFGTLLAPSRGTNELASLSSTLDVVGYFRSNPAGLIFVLCCFVLVCVIGFKNFVRFAKMNEISSLPCRRRIHSTVLDINHVLTSAYALRVRKIKNDVARISTSYFRTTKLRIRWSCGALIFPLKGDPHLRTERLLVLCCQVMLTLACSIFFLEPSAESWKTECKGGKCVLFLCDDDICRRECSACNGTTTARCNQSCEFVPNNAFIVAIFTVAITKPLALFVSQFQPISSHLLSPQTWLISVCSVQVYGLFVWLHVPEHDRIFDGDLSDSGESLSDLRVDELYERVCEAGIARSAIATKALGSANPQLSLIELLRDEVSYSCAPPVLYWTLVFMFATMSACVHLCRWTLGARLTRSQRPSLLPTPLTHPQLTIMPIPVTVEQCWQPCCRTYLPHYSQVAQSCL
jgi:hypothetical protein